ncbi:MFS domain-containing protein [Aphelenchoides fujianensis]|nr:MFS domain-containing protein [Aphelenchoides fujianensis]
MAPFSGQYRIAVLILATICVSLIFSNTLVLNFTILCMTEAKFEDFTINFGTDLFQRVDFDPPPRPDVDVSVDQPAVSLPDFEIPGIRAPTPGFNWQSFQLARNNFPLFLRIIQRVAKEAAMRTAERLGRAFDPRNVDFRQFLNGFNLSDYDPSVLQNAKEYVLNRVRTIQNSVDLFDARGRKLSKWTNHTTADDIELHNVTWNGVLNGRVRIVDKAPDLVFTPTERAILFSVVAVGALLAIVPVYRAMRTKGCRRTFMVCGLISAISTGKQRLCPMVSSYFWLFMIVRILQGIAFAACMPVIGAVTSSWARLTENGLFAGSLTSFLQIAPLITMPLSGFFCTFEGGWQLVFYVHSFLTFIFMVLWWFGYRDAPTEHSWVTIHEERRINAGKVVDARKKHAAIPYERIYKDDAVRAILIAAVGNMACIQMLIVFAPTYFKYILHYPILSVGLLAGVPTFLQFVVKLGAGILSDRITSDFLLFLLAVLPPLVDSAPFALVLYTLAVGILGFNAGGFFKSSTLVARQYAFFLNANIQAIMCLLILLNPLLVYSIISSGETEHGTFSEWAIVFILYATLLLVTGLIFGVRGSGEAAGFTEPLGSQQLNELQPVEVEREH